MFLTCLDLEGPLIPEIWIEFAKARKIDELLITTREEPDYQKLMNIRMKVLREHGLTLSDIQDTISKMHPKEGAKEFLDEIRSFSQVIIISDTFQEFAMPLMKQLGYPTLFCNSLEVDDNNMITGVKMRLPNDAKLITVKALQDIGYNVLAAGDSFNDLGMIKTANEGFLFKSPEHIQKSNPEIKAYEEYSELLAEIKKVYKTAGQN